MSVVFLVVAFAGAFLASSRSLGLGFLAMFAVGYSNGVVRSNFVSIYTTFMFDAAVLGFYLGFARGRARGAAGVGTRPAVLFVLLLIAWPTWLSLLPVNHILIQMVALRATVWFLPVLLIATRLTGADLAVMTRGLAVLNLLALAVGLYLYAYGVEALFPRNAITQVMYRSSDVGRSGHHRITSTFLNAHSYGGTMLSSLPFLLDRLAGVRVRLADRVLAAAGATAAAGGMLLCATRYPLVMAAAALAIAWVLSRFSLRVGLLGAVLSGAGAMVAGTDERLQRASTLGDAGSVVDRVGVSVNASFLDLLEDYPLGAGMGSSAGTSIPYFLADVAPEQIGMENEYCRILVDQGWIGLGGWLAFVVWLYSRPPRARPPAPWRLGVVFMYSLSMATWLTAFIGTGTLSSIPGTVLLLTQMGVLVAVRSRGAIPGDVGPRAVAPAGVVR